MHDIDADLPSLMAPVKFRNHDQPCMVIAANKAKSDAKNFREAAGILASGDDRAKAISAWLLDRAGMFEKCESDNGSADQPEA